MSRSQLSYIALRSYPMCSHAPSSQGPSKLRVDSLHLLSESPQKVMGLELFQAVCEQAATPAIQRLQKCRALKTIPRTAL